MFNRVRRFAAPVLRQATRGISTAPAARVSAFKYAYAAGAAGAAAGALWLTQEKPALVINFLSFFFTAVHAHSHPSGINPGCMLQYRCTTPAFARGILQWCRV